MQATGHQACPNCRYLQPREARRCSHCGAALDGGPKPVTVRNVLAAVGIGILVLPLGALAICTLIIGLQYIIGTMLITVALLGLDAIRRLLR